MATLSDRARVLSCSPLWCNGRYHSMACDTMTNEVLAALEAERERCAKIADEAPRWARDLAWVNPESWFGYEKACQEIAGRIRNFVVDQDAKPR